MKCYVPQKGSRVHYFEGLVKNMGSTTGGVLTISLLKRTAGQWFREFGEREAGVVAGRALASRTTSTPQINGAHAQLEPNSMVWGKAFIRS